MYEPRNDGMKEGAKMSITAGHSALNILLVGVAFLLIFSGCARLETIVKPKSEGPPSEVKKEQKSTGFVHTVQWKGETLSLIAKWYTGNGRNWKALAEANPKLNPNFIRIGEKILIPQSQAKTEEPMPRSFLSSSL